MAAAKSTQETLSPLMRILQDQVLPEVQQKGFANVIVARPTWKIFQVKNENLPPGAFATHLPLQSKKTPVRSSGTYGINAARLNARWPQDGLHSSRDSILTFVVTGRIKIQLGDYVLHCKPGQGIVIPAGNPHPDGSHLCLDEENQQGGVCEMLSFKSWGNGVECWLNHTRDGKHWSHTAVGENCHVLHPQARHYLENLAEEAVAEGRYRRLICDGLLKTLMALLLRELEEARAFQPVRLMHTELDPAAPPRQNHDPMVRAQLYIRDHLQENLSIDRVAGHVHLSRSYFTRQFRGATGKTFLAFLTDCRLERARVLLQDTQWPIDKISALVGLTPASLRVLFLRHWKMSPGEFRRQCRKR